MMVACHKKEISLEDMQEMSRLLKEKRVHPDQLIEKILNGFFVKPEK